MKGTLLFAQSGGPTAVINASAAGVIRRAQQCGFSKILCARYGIDGILKKQLYDVTHMTESQLRLLADTPASAFGSCRLKLPDPDVNSEIYLWIEEVFRQYDVRCFVYNGGNDSMDTCNKVARYFKKSRYDCAVIGVPKTVDNDLVGTHHCPGYGSAAKFVATCMTEIALDTAVYEKGRVTICEIMGRDAGWLTAASVVAKPDLICLPEVPFDVRAFYDKAMDVYDAKGRCLIALSEGIRDKAGRYVGEAGQKDSFNHTQLGGAAAFLADCITQKFGVKTRAIEFSLPTRAAGHLQSLADRRDAETCGRHAVELALQGKTDVMVTLEWQDGKSVCGSLDLHHIANEVKKVPLQYVTEKGSNVSETFLDYVLPLMEGESHPRYQRGVPVYFDSSVLKTIGR